MDDLARNSILEEISGKRATAQSIDNLLVILGDISPIPIVGNKNENVPLLMRNQLPGISQKAVIITC